MSKMALLVEGEHYGLSSYDKNSTDKTFVIVKLTDSALKNIEEYYRTKPDREILFHPNEGKLELPDAKSSISYGFTLSSVETDSPQGSFECLQQNKNKQLDSLGSMLLKMHINCNENESIIKAKHHFQAVEKENKKLCAKEIKLSGRSIGKQVKTNHPLVRQQRPASPVSKGVPKPFTNSTSASTNSSSFSTTNSQRTTAAPSNKNIKNPDLYAQSVRSRIIHLLALKSYKKPELLLKLISEGISDKAKNSISTVLSQVGVLKDNSYTLASSVWKEVQDTWKFYSSKESEFVRSKKSQMLCSENGSLPNNTSSSSTVQKRTLADVGINGHEPRNKKQRVSHYKKNDSSSKSSISNLLDSDVGGGTDAKLEAFSKPSVMVNGSAITTMNKKPVPDPFTSRKSPYDSGAPRINGFDHQPVGTTDKVSPRISGTLPKEVPAIETEKATSQPGPVRSEPNQSNPVVSVFAKNSFINSDKSLQPCSINPSTLRNPETTNHQYSSSSSQNDNRSSSHRNGHFNLSSHKSAVEPKTFPKAHPISSPNTNGYGKGKPTDSVRSVFQPADSSQGSLHHNSNLLLDSSTQRHFKDRPHSNGYHNSIALHVNRGALSHANVSSTNGSLGFSPTLNSDNDENSMDLISGNDRLFPDNSGHQPEYIRQYVTIVSRQQRNEYKEDFNSQYEEYKALHDRVKNISKKFTDLESRLHSCVPNTIEYSQIYSQILREYQENSKEGYQDARKKLNFLHEKLSHIKKLVMDYDHYYCQAVS